MQFDDALGNRQSQPSPAFPLRDRRVGLLELLEDFRLLGFGDAGSGVAHRDHEGAVGCGRLDRHLASIGELYRVADEVFLATLGGSRSGDHSLVGIDRDEPPLARRPTG